MIARNSTLTYKGQAVDVKQVGRELGVRYVLEGSVRKAGGRVRISAQLIEAEAGTHLWAEYFDGSLEDVFEMQDKVAASVAGVIEPTLQAAEMRRSAARPTTDLTAYDLYLRAVANFFPVSKAQTLAGLELLEQAIERDPHYGPALALAAVCKVRVHQDGHAADSEITRREGNDLARRALETAGSDPTAIVNAAYALAYFGEEIGAVMALVDRATALHPSFARGWYVSGMLRLMAGKPDIAIEHVETSSRLSPRDPVGTQSLVIGAANFFSRRFEQAAATLELAVQERPGAPLPHRFLAACYAHMGRLDDARAIVARLKTLGPIVVAPDTSWRNPDHRELLLSGLRLAAGGSS